jgi:hypothetical protein
MIAVGNRRSHLPSGKSGLLVVRGSLANYFDDCLKRASRLRRSAFLKNNANSATRNPNIMREGVVLTTTMLNGVGGASSARLTFAAQYMTNGNETSATKSMTPRNQSLNLSRFTIPSPVVSPPIGEP